MAAAMKAATGRMPITTPMPADRFEVALYSPTAPATPVMISHSGLVCFPAAGNAAVGRRIASTNAHTSTTNAATASAQKNQSRGVYAVTVQTYLLCCDDLLDCCPGSRSVQASTSASAAASASASTSGSAMTTGSASAIASTLACAISCACASRFSGRSPGSSLASEACAAARASASALTSLRNDS